MKKIVLSIVITTVFCMLMACGKNGITSKDLEGYEKGIKIVDLLEADSYSKHGKNMVEALQAALNASPNDFHMIDCKDKTLEQLFVHYKATYFVETFSIEECDYYYVGEMKDNRPHGFGVLTSGYEQESLVIHYIGKFKKGEVDGCYGVELERRGTYSQITYIKCEGIMKYYGVLEDGKQTYLHDFLTVSHYYGGEDSYSDMGLGTLKVAKCIPQYVGNIKKSSYSGQGVLYYGNGQIKYEGDFKQGSFHGKGELHYDNGQVQYEGEFKNGLFHGKGKLYSLEGILLQEGEYKRGKLVDGEIYREEEIEAITIEEKIQDVIEDNSNDTSNEPNSQYSNSEEKQIIDMDLYTDYTQTADEIRTNMNNAGIEVKQMLEGDAQGFEDGSLVILNYDTGIYIEMHPSDQRVIQIYGINTDMTPEESNDELVNHALATCIESMQNTWRYNINNTYMITVNGQAGVSGISITFEPYWIE